MQTQRDHVHAHQFLMARMSSALILGDPAMAENPMRRAVNGLIAGLIVGLLTVVAFGVYGFISPGGKTSWRNPGTVIVEKESGTRYVFLNGKLHPTLNMASAMIINGAGSKVQLVSRNSLKGVPHGVPVGIPGAPQVLPAQAGDVVRGPWLACLGGSVYPAVGQRIGLNLDPKAPATDLPDDRFMMVASGDRSYLIWRGNKHRITDEAVPVALGVANALPIPAPESWLAGLPDGDPLKIPVIPDAGQAGSPIDGRPADIGQLFSQGSGNGEQLFVLRSDGLAAINRTMFQLIQTGRDVTPVELSAAAVAAAPRSGNRSLSEPFTDLSAARWESGKGFALCERQAPISKTAIVSVPVLTALENSGLTSRGEPLVSMRPGSGMMVYPVPMVGVQPEPYLIVDEGRRYPLPDSQAMSALNLSTSVMVPFPRALLESVPVGPALTRNAIISRREG